jgi:hypothetical protein
MRKIALVVLVGLLVGAAAAAAVVYRRAVAPYRG